MSDNDQTLIDRCLAGDSEAFGVLVDRYQDRLYGSLVPVLGSVHDALDVAQEAFVLAYQKLDTYRGESAFYSWLFRIAYNASVSWRRRDRMPRQSLDARRETLGDEPTDNRPSNNPEHDLEICERQSMVQQALSELPPDYRAVLVLKEMDGLSYEEIATAMDVPIGTVRSRIHRARLELKEKLNRVLSREA
ncbi:MAG: sigma-70 family RNA polymerase sigma factor [Planctomycetaceae bacterium]